MAHGAEAQLELVRDFCTKCTEQEMESSRTCYEELRYSLVGCEMTIDWLNLAIGSVVGATLGVIADWQIGTRIRRWSELRALTKEYGCLAGQYLNYRIRDDGTHEPTGGTIDITWQPRDGYLEASAFHAIGNPEWHSYIRMSREYIGSGIGHYNNANSIHGGIQQVFYSKQTRSFNVNGNHPYPKGICPLLEAQGIGSECAKSLRGLGAHRYQWPRPPRPVPASLALG